MEGSVVELGIWEPVPNDRIRIVVRYREELRPIFWFSVGRDGSIYLGHLFRPISTMRRGSLTSSDGTVTIKYAEGESLDPSILDNPGKVSFHATGAINAAGERTWTDTLEGIADCRTLLLALFKHPSHYSSIDIDDVRAKDVVLDYAFDEERPLVAELAVSPATPNPLPEVKPGVTHQHQLNLVFQYSGLNLIPPNIHLRLNLWNGPAGPWPPYAYLIWRTTPD